MPLQSTQDLEARFAVFLNPIKDLTKNWEVDIAKYLEEYLVELSEIQITFDGGETTMNFAEAAMLIQGSAAVYSKKVEFLWQMVLQMLDTLNKRSLEARGGAPRPGGEFTKFKSHDSNLEFSEVDNLTVGRNIDMKEDENEDEMRERFKFLPAMPLHLVDKEGEKSILKIALYLKNMEVFGNKEDFRINRSYLTPSGILCLDLPPEILKQKITFIKEGPLNESIAGFHIVEKEIPLLEAIPNDLQLEDGMNVDDFDPGGCDAAECFDVSQHGFDENKVEDSHESDAEKSGQAIGRTGLRKRQVKDKLENANKVNLKVPLEPCDPHIETPAKRPVRAGRLRRPMPCSCHKDQRKEKKGRLPKDAEQTSEKMNVINSIEGYITNDLANLVHNNNNNFKSKIVDPSILEALAQIQEEQKDVLKRERNKKQLEEDQLRSEEATPKLDGPIIDDAFDDSAPDLDLDGFEGNDAPLPNPHPDSPFLPCVEGNAIPKTMNDSMFYEPGSDYEALVQKWVSEYISSAQEYIASSELTRRVNKWRQIILPKLEEEEERKGFDIHDYGSFILEQFSDEGTETILFDDLVKNSSSRDVSRIFLSCLMLANTYNIELGQRRDEELPMDSVDLKLLSRVRHHKKLELFGPTTNHAPRKRKSAPNKRKKHFNSDDNDDDDASTSPDVPVRKKLSYQKKTKVVSSKR